MGTVWPRDKRPRVGATYRLHNVVAVVEAVWPGGCVCSPGRQIYTVEQFSKFKRIAAPDHNAVRRLEA